MNFGWIDVIRKDGLTSVYIRFLMFAILHSGGICNFIAYSIVQRNEEIHNSPYNNSPFCMFLPATSDDDRNGLSDESHRQHSHNQ